MKIVSATEMRAIDRATSERFGVPSLTLMENAGTAVADYVLSHYAAVQRIVVFCGKGNNGGDGFVAARRLHQQGKKVQVILLADPSDLRGDAAIMFGKLPNAAIAVHFTEELKSDRMRHSLQADLYLDAILGTGFKPPVTGLYADAIAIMNASAVPVIAVDIPSGADADATGPQNRIKAAMATFWWLEDHSGKRVRRRWLGRLCCAREQGFRRWRHQGRCWRRWRDFIRS